MRWLKRKAGISAAPSPATRPSVLQTARLALHPLQEADVDALHALWLQPALRRFLWDGRALSREQVREAALQSQWLFAEQGCGLWLARDAEQRLVGFCGYWTFRDAHELELLYGVDESQCSRGYAREMAAALVGYGFDTLRFDEIRASTDAPNLASQRVLRRLGFVPDAPRQGAPGKLFFRLPRARREDVGEGWEAA